MQHRDVFKVLYPPLRTPYSHFLSILVPFIDRPSPHVITVVICSIQSQLSKDQESSFIQFQ